HSAASGADAHLFQCRYPEASVPKEGELELATRLIASITGDFEPALWRDNHRQRVRDLIESSRARSRSRSQPSGKLHTAKGRGTFGREGTAALRRNRPAAEARCRARRRRSQQDEQA